MSLLAPTPESITPHKIEDSTVLTKDLLRFRALRGAVKPDFVSVENSSLLLLARNFLDTYKQSIGTRRGEIDEIIQSFVQGFPDLKIAKGLNKLILNRCEFAHSEELEYAGRRADILERSSQILDNPKVDSIEKLRRSILNKDPSFTLYPDLPNNEKLVRLKELLPNQLLQRYNIALVQGLLINASSITIETNEPNVQNLRRVLKFLKFFRLLSRIFPKKKEGLSLKIDGPMSILDSARKYGLQLASFFPAICLLSDWKISCEIKVRKRSYVLKLDQSSNLVSHYRNLSAYIPEEIMMFANHFKENSKEWEMDPKTPLINIDGGEIAFPDFTFVDSQGKQVYLELFHRWHRTNLIPRIRFCIENTELPLILGIDRLLLKGELKDLLNTGVLPDHRYFSFNDYPSIKKVQACLSGFETNGLNLFSSEQE